MGVLQLGTSVLALYFACLTTVVHAEPRRLVSLGGAVTEIVAALGSEDALVAVDDSSVYPEALLGRLPSVGYYRTLSPEAVLSTRPQLILASAGAGPQSALARIGKAGVDVVQVPEVRSPTELVEAIGVVGEALGKNAAAARLSARIEKQMRDLEARLAGIRTEPGAVFVLGLQGGRLMVAGSDTAADSLMRLAGARNLAADSNGYKPASAETMVALAPEVIVTTVRTAAGAGGEKALLTSAGIEATPAARNGRLVVLDDLLALGFGPRLPTAIARLAEGLHPAFEARPL